MKAKDPHPAKKTPSSFVCLLVACIIEIVIGILLLINPIGFTGAIVVVAGLALIVWGVLRGIRYFKADPVQASQQQELAKGLGAVLLGGICVFEFNWLAVATPLLGTAYGLAILAAAVFKTQRAVDLLRLKRQFWYIAGIGALVALVMGFIIILNPFPTDFLWGFIAVTLLVTGVIDVVALCLSTREKPMKTKIVMNESGEVQSIKVQNAPIGTPAPQTQAQGGQPSAGKSELDKVAGTPALTGVPAPAATSAPTAVAQPASPADAPAPKAGE